MIEEILPVTAAWAECLVDPPDAVLFDEEAVLIRRAVSKRRREFTTGRMCARSALADLGFPPSPILQRESGAPRWPPGVVGSITHCAGYRAAAVARSRDLVTMGIDAEPDHCLSAGALDLVALPEEIDDLRELTRARPRGPAWDRLLFCAKETVYKAWFPLTGRWLGFEQATILIDPVAGTFLARILLPAPTSNGPEVRAFAGRWLARNGLIIAAIAVPAGQG